MAAQGPVPAHLKAPGLGALAADERAGGRAVGTAMRESVLLGAKPAGGPFHRPGSRSGAAIILDSHDFEYAQETPRATTCHLTPLRFTVPQDFGWDESGCTIGVLNMSAPAGGPNATREPSVPTPSPTARPAWSRSPPRMATGLSFPQGRKAPLPSGRACPPTERADRSEPAPGRRSDCVTTRRQARSGRRRSQSDREKLDASRGRARRAPRLDSASGIGNGDRPAAARCTGGQRSGRAVTGDSGDAGSGRAGVAGRHAVVRAGFWSRAADCLSRPAGDRCVRGDVRAPSVHPRGRSGLALTSGRARPAHQGRGWGWEAVMRYPGERDRPLDRGLTGHPVVPGRRLLREHVMTDD
jgi:hypothetical protein